MTTYTGYDFWKDHEVPWPVVPLRRVARLGTGHTPSRNVEEYWDDCTIPWVTTEDLTSRTGTGLEPLHSTRQKISQLGLDNSAAVLHPKDTVMLSRTASVGHVVRIGTPMATTQAFVTWTCGPELDPPYLTATLLAMNPEFFRLAYGSTHLTIYMPDIEQLRVPLPPLHEQRAIADYLDTETARIDTLITKKRRLAKLVDARWAAEKYAVFTGSRVGEPTKPSGVDWLRRIPGHWTRLPLKHLFRFSKGKDAQRLSAEYVAEHPGPYPVFSGQTKNGGQFGSIDTYDFDLGTPALLVSTVGGSKTTGHVQAISGRFSLSQNCAILIPREIDALGIEFFAAQLTEIVRYKIAELPAHIQTSLRIEDLARFWVVTPPSDDRAALAQKLRDRNRKVVSLVSALDRQVKLLVDRRQALVTAAVTGGLAVPGVAA